MLWWEIERCYAKDGNILNTKSSPYIYIERAYASGQ